MELEITKNDIIKSVIDHSTVFDLDSFPVLEICRTSFESQTFQKELKS